MMMIDKGIKKNLRAINTQRGRLARKIYMRTKFLRSLTLFGLILITFIEKPDWCLRDSTLENTNSCNLEEKIYPNSNIKYLDPIPSKIIQIVLIIILLGF